MTREAVEHLRRDPIMGELMGRVGPMRLRPRRLPPFQALTQSIVYQQLSGKAAGTIFGRFQALYDHQGFPTPQAVLKTPPERLRSAGLSRPKTAYILGLAEQAAAGFIPSLAKCDEMTDAELLERFTQIKGIGRWTVEMLLIFNLGRPDVLPIHDLGVRKGFRLTYRKRQLPEPEQLERFGARWSPHRTTAAWYLWRALEEKN